VKGTADLAGATVPDDGAAVPAGEPAGAVLLAKVGGTTGAGATEAGAVPTGAVDTGALAAGVTLTTGAALVGATAGVELATGLVTVHGQLVIVRVVA